MPATFSEMGLNFLYPENWKLQKAEDASEEGEGVILELPSGGFLSIERVASDENIASIIDQLTAAFQEEYGEIETEDLAADSESLPGVKSAVDFRFYYLDLLIVSRFMLIQVSDVAFALQFQAENRDFEENELVVSAVLKQISSAA